MKAKTIQILLFLFFSFAGYAQNNSIFIRAEDNPELKVTIDAYFGISLMNTLDGGFIRYGFIQIKSTGETQITYLSEAEFMQQVTGQQKSKANPNQVNLLEEKRIMWQTFEELWKLRYAEYPYDGARSTETGWAGRNFAPSVRQWSFLKQNYGYSEFSQFLYGESMWKLVRDSQDASWQNQYKSLK